MSVSFFWCDEDLKIKWFSSFLYFKILLSFWCDILINVNYLYLILFNTWIMAPLNCLAKSLIYVLTLCLVSFGSDEKRSYLVPIINNFIFFTFDADFTSLWKCWHVDSIIAKSERSRIKVNTTNFAVCNGMSIILISELSRAPPPFYNTGIKLAHTTFMLRQCISQIGLIYYTDV